MTSCVSSVLLCGIQLGMHPVFVCLLLPRGIGSSKVTVLGYGLLTTDARPLVEALTKQRFAVVVVDESHYLKSRNAARTKILVPLVQSAKRAVLLTGTPALGRPEEVNGTWRVGMQPQVG